MGTVVSKSDPKVTIEAEPNKIDKEIVRESVSSCMIEEKERKRHKEQNEPETQMAITDAEKMLEIYRKEQRLGSETKPVSRNKPEMQNRQKKQYKTSDFDNRGRIAQFSYPKTEELDSYPKNDEHVYNNSQYVYSKPVVMQDPKMTAVLPDSKPPVVSQNTQIEPDQRNYSSPIAHAPLQSWQNQQQKSPGLFKNTLLLFYYSLKQAI